MNSRTVAAIVSLALLLPLSVSAFTFSRSICYGDAGTTVSNLQQFLIDDGYTSVSVTGYFGSVTRAALASFQVAENITPATGCTGRITRSHISSIEAAHPDWTTTLSNSNGYTNVSGAPVHSPAYSSNGIPAGATAQCQDGTYSFSMHHSGTCSHHGGVASWL